MNFHFNALLTTNGWLDDAYISCDANGLITSIEKSPSAGITYEKIDGYALPGFQNSHSHAFQYAMCGMAELHRGAHQADDFWSWRTAMYNVALQLNPDAFQAVAEQLYAEMLRHGITAVTEFHYVHHDEKGHTYENPAELGIRLMEAAEKVGIKMTLVPQLYTLGGFNKPATDLQRRFISKDVDSFDQLWQATQQAAQNYTLTTLGIGAHSLRAVAPDHLADFIAYCPTDIPFHMHISEQLQEVADCLEATGKRPVEWLLENINVKPNFHLVHATHMTDAEAKGLAETGAKVVLCPSTEGNLGDGVFNFKTYTGNGGQWCIGTDSQIGINPLEDLRLVDYVQRVHTHNRQTFGTGDTGFNAIKMAFFSGKSAMGHAANDFFAVGQPLDAAIYSTDNPLLSTASADLRCNTLVYSSDARHYYGTLVNGQWRVKAGLHLDGKAIAQSFHNQLTKSGLRH